MAWWAAALDVLAVIAACALLAFAFLFVRRRWLSRAGGTFECSVRTTRRSKGPPGTARGWTLGLGRYAGDELEWFRVFSFAHRPKHVFKRSLEVLERRTPQGSEAFSLYAGHVVVAVLLSTGQRIELAMSETALTGFLAWTEAAPPGHDRLFR